MYDASIQNPGSLQNSYGIQPTQFNKFDFGQTLDSVMNNAIQYQMAQKQLSKSNIDLQNTQIQQNQYLSHFGVSPSFAANPSNWQQANQPQQTQPEPGQGQGMMANPGQPMPEDPQITGLRMMQQAATNSINQQVQQTQAQTQTLQAQAAEATGMNALMGFGPPGQSGPGQVSQGPNMFEENVNALKSGQLSPSLLAQQMSRAPEPMKIAMAHTIAQHLQSGDLNMEDAENKYQAKQEGATAQSKVQKGQGQNLGTAAGNVDDMLAKAAPLIAKLNTSQLSSLNNFFLKGKALINDPDVYALKNYLSSALGSYAIVRNNGNAASESDKEAFADMFPDGLNAAAFAGAQRAMHDEGASKMSRMQGQGYQQKPLPTKSKYSGMTAQQLMQEAQRQMSQGQ